MENVNSPNWLTKVFAPRTNFYTLLIKQSEKTLEGILALQSWICQGISDRCQQVRDCEHQADDLVLDLQTKLVDSFITPFDREDIYDLSDYLDEVINAAKTTAREIEALEINTKDYFLEELVATVVEGTRCLTQTFCLLEHNLLGAQKEASLARKAENRASKVYQQAIRHLFTLDDFKKIQKFKEAYSSLVQITEKIDHVAVKLLHVIVKIR